MKYFDYVLSLKIRSFYFRLRLISSHSTHLVDTTLSTSAVKPQFIGTRKLVLQVVVTRLKKSSKIVVQ